MRSRDQIFELLRTHKSELFALGIERVGLFGSAVRNEASEQSDIDILLDIDPDKETFNNFMAACSLLEQLFVGQKLDIVTKNGLSPYIGPYILKEVIYV